MENYLNSHPLSSDKSQKLSHIISSNKNTVYDIGRSFPFSKSSPSRLPLQQLPSKNQSHFSRIISKIPLAAILQRLPGIWLLAVIALACVGPNSLWATTDWLQEYLRLTGTSSSDDTSHDLPYDHILHIIIIPNYAESLETICETLDVLASHVKALTQYRICLAMEESEEGSISKARMLLKIYTDSFFDITFTIHPSNILGEIRGKSSNVSWAAREMAKYSSIASTTSTAAAAEGYNDGVFNACANYNPREHRDTAAASGIPINTGSHTHEIITVLDCDTIFAEDYFAAMTCHYAVASPEQRKIMMFMPSTVFDSQVPVFVRTCDIYWSLGVISSMYDGSPIKFPCSAYSISMDLCISVNFWDAGPESIGEDMHMYLKCFFSTGGKVNVKSIYSAASCCNIESSNHSATYPFKYFLQLFMRYQQAKRHLWGSLDTGYALKRTILSFLAPEIEPAIIQLKNASVSKEDKYSEATGLTKNTGVENSHLLLETHCLMGHFAIMGLIRSIMMQIDPNWEYHPPAFPQITFFGVRLTFDVFSTFIIGCCVVCNFVSASFYERYYKFVAFERWALQSFHPKTSGLFSAESSENTTIPEIICTANTNVDIAGAATAAKPIFGKHSRTAAAANVSNNRLVGLATMAKHGMRFSKQHENLKVFPLGRRPQLSSRRTALNLLEYRVSGKPELKNSSLAMLTMEEVVMSAKGLGQNEWDEGTVPYAQVILNMTQGGNEFMSVNGFK
ncbi:hypothetical protein HK100_012949 [Physocladia obscura]|uniref:Glycosyltransferase 2-like domain-containing protein n=1 Tax=Physocladia obscura TaxID=109957 RepID=A0AAD5XCU2_9FUNG|nr:hypothetical protein HK100_012949 [Physocladia obscura]